MLHVAEHPEPHKAKRHAAERRATYEDVLRAPPERVAEIIHGRLYTHPRPASRHALAGSSLGVIIGNQYHRMDNGSPGGWWILYEPELHRDDQILVPDLAGWRRRRMPKFPDAPYFELAPDWVCEVLSPSTARMDRVLKMPLYAQFGVGHLWLLDPKLQTLEVFESREDKWFLWGTFQENDTVAAAPFDALSFGLGALWP
uniref:Endonuclease, Uma2 family (Restriction endonuclease fold) n=1 Tax=Candidatus Kentrum sp. LFY TaxID=2126342 RepID=A0A450WVD8_9GAMM|nr:MAG: Endonuclease, Uma2 family (restriction endonuclease fold) [Candidatus Kentron sp. LFY]